MGVAREQFKIDKGLSETWEIEWVVAAGAATTIVAGSPAKISGYDAAGFGSGAVIPMVDGDGIVGSASTRWQFVGLAKDDSTDTAAAAGIVETWMPIPDLTYRGACKTSTTMNTQAKIDALMGIRVKFDLTSSVWTVDAAAADALANCVVIVGGNPRTNEAYFVYAPKGCFYDTATAVTS